jgi:hypothetical protein
MIKLATSILSAMATLVKTSTDNAATAGMVHFYTGEMPATTGGAITTQVLIGTCPLSKPCGTVTGGVLTFDTISDDLAADNTGTIGFGRVVDGDGNFIFDGDAGLTSSTTAFFRFVSLAAVAGGTVKINSMTFGVGE